jgi:hypothetical protein
MFLVSDTITYCLWVALSSVIRACYHHILFVSCTITRWLCILLSHTVCLCVIISPIFCELHCKMLFAHDIVLFVRSTITFIYAWYSDICSLHVITYSKLRVVVFLAQPKILRYNKLFGHGPRTCSLYLILSHVIWAWPYHKVLGHATRMFFVPGTITWWLCATLS